MDLCGSFVWCRRAIDSAGGGEDWGWGAGVCVGGIQRDGVQAPPAACWERELEPGTELEGITEGHNTLFSALNPSVTCHTFVMDGERKSVKGRKGEDVKKKEQ